MDFTQLSTDLESQPITGYLPNGAYLDIPLISHIKDNLYVGGCINDVDLGDFFTHIFSLYKWERYVYDVDKTKLYEFEMYDSRDTVDAEAVERISGQVVEALEAGGNVLVHCQAGINRSNLIAGSALMKMGYTSHEAIETLSVRSPLILANPTFRRFLHTKREEQVDYPSGL